MFKRVLYPTDFSPCAEAVIPYLVKMKEAGTQEVILCHIIDERYPGMLIPPGAEEILPPVQVDFQRALEEENRQRIDKLAKKLSKHFRVKSLLEYGIPFRSILEIAEREKVSLIIIGSHGKSNLAEILLGSVSEKIVRKSKYPCLVIKRGDGC